MEQWKPIKGYEGLYEVSNLGNVKSLSRMKGKGNVCYKAQELILKTGLTNGYRTLTLWKNGIRWCIKSARLVALTFIPNPENKRTINHINGIKTDDRLVNLEWATDSENIKHAFRTGLKNNDSISKPVLMSKKDGTPLLIFSSSHEAHRMTNINRGNITTCCNNSRYTAGGYRWSFAGKTV